MKPTTHESAEFTTLFIMHSRFTNKKGYRVRRNGLYKEVEIVTLIASGVGSGSRALGRS